MKRFFKAWQKSQARGIVFVLLLAFLLCLALVLKAKPGTPDLWLAQEKPVELRSGWAENGAPLPELPTALRAAQDGTVEVSRVLRESEARGNAILLRTSQQQVEVLLNGQSIYRYNGQAGAPMDVGPGAAKHMVRLPAGWPGSTLTLRFTGTTPEEPGNLEMVYLGTKAALLTLVARQALPGLVACFLAITAGAGLLVASLMFREQPTVARLRWLGALAMVAGLWGALETRSFQLFSGNMTLCYALVFLTFALVPVCAVGFLLTYPGFSQSRWLRVVYWLSVANFLWVQAAQIFGWAPYIKTVPGVHLMLVLAIVGVFGGWLKKGGGTKIVLEPQLFAACVLFAGFGIVDMLRFYLDKQNQDDVLFTRWGFLFFVGALGWQVLQQASAERAAVVERRTLRRLAYTDALTGLANRTAFEQCMEEYRRGLRSGLPLLLVADLNQLKHINDNFGHAAGDAAIIHCAASLREAFEEAGQVYRIGGDEFFVLDTLEGPGKDEDFAQRAAQFDAQMKKRGEAEPYRLQAAYGWCRREPGESIDHAFTRADRRMYRCKSEMGKDPALCAEPG